VRAPGAACGRNVVTPVCVLIPYHAVLLPLACNPFASQDEDEQTGEDEHARQLVPSPRADPASEPGLYPRCACMHLCCACCGVVLSFAWWRWCACLCVSGVYVCVYVCVCLCVPECACVSPCVSVCRGGVGGMQMHQSTAYLYPPPSCLRPLHRNSKFHSAVCARYRMLGRYSAVLLQCSAV
jgi:hypothetical protein